MWHWIFTILLTATLTEAVGQGTLIWTGEPDRVGAWYGNSVSQAGDVNGDGFDDVIIGAPHDWKDDHWEGIAYAYYGSSSGLDTASNWLVEGDQYQAELGRSVAGGGDVNGDGYDDVVVGIQYFDGGQTNEGAARIYLGSATGLSMVPHVVLECDQQFAMFGQSVAIAGDVNGDGYDDVLIGSPYYNNGPTNEGTAFLYYGSAVGVDPIPDWTWDTDQASAYVWVKGIDDLNGDGFSDILLTSALYDSPENDEGKAFLFMGSPTGPGSIPDWTFDPDDDYSYLRAVASGSDINGDGYSDLVLGAEGYGTLPGTLAGEGALFTFFGTLTVPSNVPASTTMLGCNHGCHFGVSVDGVGDLNGDGFDDIVAGAYGWSNGEYGEGRALIFAGGPTGLVPMPLWDHETDQSSAHYGMSVAGGMDTNGDGSPEWLVGARSFSNGEVDEGMAFLYQYPAIPLSSESEISLPSSDQLMMEHITGGVRVLNPEGLVGSLQVMNFLGSTIYFDRNYRTGEEAFTGEFPFGQYIVRLQADNRVWVGRFIMD